MIHIIGADNVDLPMRNLKRTGSPNLSLNIEIASATILCPVGIEHIRQRTWSYKNY